MQWTGKASTLGCDRLTITNANVVLPQERTRLVMGERMGKGVGKGNGQRMGKGMGKGMGKERTETMLLGVTQELMI